MKQIDLVYLKELDEIVLSDALDVLENGEGSVIEEVNWPMFPYKPITDFYLARSSKAIFIKFRVRGNILKAICTRDNEVVSEDRSVAFFVKKPEDEQFCAFTFNCIGVCSATKQVENGEKIFLEKEDMIKIERYSTLGKIVVGEMEGLFDWELIVSIPFNLIGVDPDNLPKKLQANFYKSATFSESSHYLTWNKIKTEHLEFYQPKYFGELLLEGVENSEE